MKAISFFLLVSIQATAQVGYIQDHCKMFLNKHGIEIVSKNQGKADSLSYQLLESYQFGGEVLFDHTMASMDKEWYDSFDVYLSGDEDRILTLMRDDPKGGFKDGKKNATISIAENDMYYVLLIFCY